MMNAYLIKSYDLNLRYARELVEDVLDEQMTQSPYAGLENHPAFTLGHLTTAAALMAKYLGEPYDLNPEWDKLFRRKGPGDPRMPDPNASLYPTKSALLAELTRQHQRVEQLVTNLDESDLEKPTKWRFSHHLPTLGDLLYFMCVTHEAMHLGQLAGWRRAMGLPSALARL